MITPSCAVRRDWAARITFIPSRWWAAIRRTSHTKASAFPSNGATLAGHVTIEDHAQVGAFCPVHQFCRIGEHAYIAAHTVITQDVPPFSKSVAPRGTRCFGVNRVGLERQGFSSARIAAIEKAYRLLLRSKLNTSQALEKMRGTLAASPDVLTLVQFIEAASSDRGLTK